MFLIAAAVTLITVIIALAYPLLKTTADSVPLCMEASGDQDRIDLEIEKQTLLNSLADLDLDLAQRRLTPADYQRLRAIDEHRLARIFEKMDALGQKEPPRFVPAQAAGSSRSGLLRYAGSAVLGLLVMVSAAAIYGHVSGRIGLAAQRDAAQRRAASPNAGMPNPLEMVARLESRLKANPNDLESQLMIGRSYMALQRYEDAQKAWQKVVELNFGNYEAHFSLGLILLQTTSRDNQQALEEALKQFDIALVKVPREPAILWYRGVVLVHLKQYSLADESWTTAFQNLAPGGEDAEFVKQALQSLRAGTPPLY